MTGRAAGYCAGHPVPGFANRGFGRGMGMAWGLGGGGGRGLAWRRGRGGGWGFGPAALGPDYVPPVQSREQELDMLRAQSDWLKEQMQAIDARLQELQQTKD